MVQALAMAPLPAAPRATTQAAAASESDRRVIVQSTLVTARVTRPPTDAAPESWPGPLEGPVGTAGRTAIPATTLRVSSPAQPMPPSRSFAEATRPPAVSNDDAPPAAVSTIGTPASAARPTEVASTTWAPIEARRAVASSVTDDVSREKETVLAVLHEYSRAYERLDVGATKAVYPTIDARRLQRAFQELQGQHLRFANCGVNISSSGAGANARCTGDATYRPKVGSRVVRLTNLEWTFSLARDGSGWQILDARMQ